MSHVILMTSFSIFSSLRLCLAAAIAVFAFLGEIKPTVAASTLTKVVIGYPSPSPKLAPIWIAQDHDFFGKYGTTVDLVFVRNTQTLIAGIAAANIDVGYTGGTTVLGAAAGGMELKMVSAFQSRGRGYLVVRPEIKTPADLSGKRFGVQSIGGTLWMYAMLALEQFGLDVTRDRIRILVIGDQTLLVRAMETQLIDATVFTSGTYSLSLEQKGFPLLVEMRPSMATTGLVVSKSYLQRNSETLENVMKAMMEGLIFALAPRNKSQVIKTIMGRLKLSDASLAEEGYAALVKDFETRPYPSIESLRSLHRLMQLQNPRLATINLANLIDSTFVRKLDESGFIGQLQARYSEAH
ncbi:MAG: ABC transporter substrate-binding protein [Deltaproteobacteria bacterium]|nr:ABC transporter substrate-binding protein [Deltaproteobacteria bacterium]